MTGKWRIEDVPHRGWEVVSEDEDQSKPTCQMCEAAAVKYGILVRNDRYPGVLRVGETCAAALTLPVAEGQRGPTYDSERTRLSSEDDHRLKMARFLAAHPLPHVGAINEVFLALRVGDKISAYDAVQYLRAGGLGRIAEGMINMRGNAIDRALKKMTLPELTMLLTSGILRSDQRRDVQAWLDRRKREEDNRIKEAFARAEQEKARRNSEEAEVETAYQVALRIRKFCARLHKLGGGNASYFDDLPHLNWGQIVIHVARVSKGEEVPYDDWDLLCQRFRDITYHHEEKLTWELNDLIEALPSTSAARSRLAADAKMGRRVWPPCS